MFAMGLRPKTVPIPVDVREQYDALLAEVYGFALARCGDRALAEDVTQDAFAAAITAYQAGRTDAFRAPFLVTVARNKLVDHWRRAQREEAKRVRTYERPIGDVDELLAEIDSDARRERVLAALGELVPRAAHRIDVPLSRRAASRGARPTARQQ